MSERVLHNGIGVVVPDGWTVEVDPAEGLALVATEPPRAVDGVPLFRANLVLTVESTGGLGFRDWQAGTDELLPRVLEDYLLLDLEKRPVAGEPGGRRLAHHVAPDGVALTMEQWFTLVDGVGVTLTATVDSWRYDELADLLAQSADRLELTGEVRP